VQKRTNPFYIFGGAEGDRTPDLMTASHALSQLSYSPLYFNIWKYVVILYQSFFDVSIIFKDFFGGDIPYFLKMVKSFGRIKNLICQKY
jgi:hypothetical protein